LSPRALAPFFWLVSHHIARNHVTSDLRDPSNTVPAIDVVWW
jgi:hypothetical protein